MTAAATELLALSGRELERVGRHRVLVTRRRRRLRLRRGRSRRRESGHIGGDGGGNVVVHSGGNVADVGGSLLVGEVRLVRLWRRQHFGNVFVV